MQRPRQAYAMELTAFHSEDYVNFLARVTPDNQDEMQAQLAQFNMGEDCPVFDGLYDFCRRCAEHLLLAASAAHLSLHKLFCPVLICSSVAAGACRQARHGWGRGKHLPDFFALHQFFCPVLVSSSLLVHAVRQGMVRGVQELARVGGAPLLVLTFIAYFGLHAGTRALASRAR